MLKKILVVLILLSFVMVVACKSKQEQAREMLKKLNVEFTPDSFVECAKNSDLVAVENFLEAGMSPDSNNSEGCTAMFYAKMQHNEKLIVILIKHGAREVNLDKMIGKWAFINDPSFAQIEISKDGDQYIYWGSNPYDLNDDKPFPFKANLINENTLSVLFDRPSRQIHVKLGDDGILSVSGIKFERISK